MEVSQSRGSNISDNLVLLFLTREGWGQAVLKDIEINGLNLTRAEIDNLSLVKYNPLVIKKAYRTLWNICDKQRHKDALSEKTLKKKLIIGFNKRYIRQFILMCFNPSLKEFKYMSQKSKSGQNNPYECFLIVFCNIARSGHGQHK